MDAINVVWVAIVQLTRLSPRNTCATVQPLKYNFKFRVRTLERVEGDNLVSEENTEKQHDVLIWQQTRFYNKFKAKLQLHTITIMMSVAHTMHLCISR